MLFRSKGVDLVQAWNDTTVFNIRKPAQVDYEFRTTAAVRATPTTPRKPASATATRSPKQAAVAPEPAEEMYEPAPPRTGPPTWLQITSFVLAIIGLAISAYETWAHYNGSHLFA